MKKTKIMTAAVALCMAAAMFAGCSSEPTSGESAVATRIEGGQTQIAIENSEADTSMDNEYGFTYNGYKVYPGMQSSEALAILGDDYDQREDASCAGQGVDVAYMYQGFTLGAYRDNGVELIEVIQVDDSIIDCGGIHVGDSLKAAKEILGTPTTEYDFGVAYKGIKTQLEILTDGVDTIIGIVYRVNK